MLLVNSRVTRADLAGGKPARYQKGSPRAANVTDLIRAGIPVDAAS
jgi:hypothetical protein